MRIVEEILKTLIPSIYPSIEIKFQRYSSNVWCYTEKPIDKYLFGIGFVESGKDSIWRKGFTCIDINSLEIWHHGVSKIRTKIEGDMVVFINYFNKI